MAHKYCPSFNTPSILQKPIDFASRFRSSKVTVRYNHTDSARSNTSTAKNSILKCAIYVPYLLEDQGSPRLFCLVGFKSLGASQAMPALLSIFPSEQRLDYLNNYLHQIRVFSAFCQSHGVSPQIQSSIFFLASEWSGFWKHANLSTNSHHFTYFQSFRPILLIPILQTKHQLTDGHLQALETPRFG